MNENPSVMLVNTVFIHKPQNTLNVIQVTASFILWHEKHFEN